MENGIRDMSYHDQRVLLRSRGWTEEGIALWTHPGADPYYIDWNSDMPVIKKFCPDPDHYDLWEIDNFYGVVTNLADLEMLEQGDLV